MSEEAARKQKPEKCVGAGEEQSQATGVPDIGNLKCTGPEAEDCLVCSRTYPECSECEVRSKAEGDVKKDRKDHESLCRT